MKIAINATCLNDRPSGAKNRFVGIYNEIFRDMCTHSFVIYQAQDCNMRSWFDDLENISFKTVPCNSYSRISRFISHYTFWKKELKDNNFDLLESLHQPIVKNTYSHGATLSTIYDVRGSLEGNFFKRLVYKYLIWFTLKSSDAVITISETIKSEILSLEDHASINVIGCGIDNTTPTFSKDSDLWSRFSKINFLLSVGHLENRKNYKRLILSFSRLLKLLPDKHLVIIGNDNGDKKKRTALIDTLNLKENVILLENISDQELNTIYHLSKGVIFPSLYEGFGIPILETMIHKKPLILSNINVFQEITEGNAFFFDPFDENEIVRCMESVFVEPEKFIDKIEYGKKRVNDFSFKKLALDSIKSFESTQNLKSKNF